MSTFRARPDGATGRWGDRAMGRWGERGNAALTLLVFALLAAACNPGSYPVDVFQEMHYQASQRLLEPERRAPPEGAVPVTGSSPALSFEQATPLANPVPRTPETSARGREVFRVNCAACHGQDGHGQGVVAQYFVQAKVVPPVDLASPRVRERTDGQLYWIVTNGLGNMPPFRDLLTEDDRWTLVQVIREVQGR